MKPVLSRCPICREVFPGPHDCGKAMEARAVFEAAKRANDPDTRRQLGDRAYDLCCEAEALRHAG